MMMEEISNQENSGGRLLRLFMIRNLLLKFCTCCCVSTDQM